ncbi:hypothetical protein KJ839_06735 [Patescibacteria group bacterium]|nr:hypothetical protein [Patescibacteria group bacterium]
MRLYQTLSVSGFATVILIFVYSSQAIAEVCIVDAVRETEDEDALYRLEVGVHDNAYVVCLARVDEHEDTSVGEVIAVADSRGTCNTLNDSTEDVPEDAFNGLVVIVAYSGNVVLDGHGRRACNDTYDVGGRNVIGDFEINPAEAVESLEDTVPVYLINTENNSSPSIQYRYSPLHTHAPFESSSTNSGFGIESVTYCSMDGSNVYAVYGRYRLDAITYNTTMLVCDTLTDDIICTVSAPNGSSDYVDITGNNYSNLMYHPASATFCKSSGGHDYYVNTWYASWAGHMILEGDDAGDVLYGSPNADYIYGDADNDMIFGDSGGDFIEGNDGADDIYGEEGADDIYGWCNCAGCDDSSSDYIEGGIDNDYIWGDGTDVTGTGGDDIIYGGLGGDHIYGGPGDDELHGEESSDYIYGWGGNDTIYGGSSSDVIYGDQTASDSINGADTIDGGSGYDYIYAGRDALDEVDGSWDCARCDCQGGGSYLSCEDTTAYCMDDC